MSFNWHTYIMFYLQGSFFKEMAQSCIKEPFDEDITSLRDLAVGEVNL